MVDDPWGPPKKRYVTKLQTFAGALNKIGIEEFEIEGRWEGGLPILLQEQFVSILNAMDADMNLHPIVNTSGEITEVSAATIETNVQGAQYLNRQVHPWFTHPTNTDKAWEGRFRYIAKSITLVGGALANLELLPALAGYTGHMLFVGLNMNSADTYVLTFQDEDDAQLLPKPNRIDAVIGTAYVPYTPEKSLTFSGIADNKALEVDITGGAGAEEGGIYGIGYYET